MSGILSFLPSRIEFYSGWCKEEVRPFDVLYNKCRIGEGVAFGNEPSNGTERAHRDSLTRVAGNR